MSNSVTYSYNFYEIRISSGKTVNAKVKIKKPVDNHCREFVIMEDYIAF